MQLPKMLPKFLSARLSASVVLSFFAFSNAMAFPFAFSICPYPISYIISNDPNHSLKLYTYLMKTPIPQRNPHNNTQPQANLPRRSILIHEINLNILNRTTPPIEPEYLIREIYCLLRRQVMYLPTAGTRSRGDELGA